MFYVFHGDDDFGSQEELHRLRAQLADLDPVSAELNTNILDGQRVTLGELRHASNAVPFLGERRMVIVHGLLTRLSPARRSRGRRAREVKEPAWKASYLRELVEYLGEVPDTTRLFFVESQELGKSNPVLKRARALGGDKAHIKLFSLPSSGALPGWTQRRARTREGDLSPEAAALLANLVGEDLRLLDHEIEKLLLYADGRQVTSDDVQLLVSRSREASIFDLVDKVGLRQTGEALRLMHEQLDDLAAPLYLLSMLSRQVRILIQVSECRQRELTPRLAAKEIGLHPYPTEKAYGQSRRFTMNQLERAHEHLVRTDSLIKTGRVEPILALDMLVVALTQV